MNKINNLPPQVLSCVPNFCLNFNAGNISNLKKNLIQQNLYTFTHIYQLLTFFCISISVYVCVFCFLNYSDYAEYMVFDPNSLASIS